MILSSNLLASWVANKKKYIFSYILTELIAHLHCSNYQQVIELAN